MVEKKIVVDGLRFTYSGIFELSEFFKALEDWEKKQGYEREVKSKREHVEQTHKRMAYDFELWKGLQGYVRSVIHLKALFDNVEEVVIQRQDLKRTMQKGKVLIVIDGFIETDIEHRWMQKPWYVFMKSFVDRYIWNMWFWRHDGSSVTDCNSLYNACRDYFRKH